MILFERYLSDTDAESCRYLRGSSDGGAVDRALAKQDVVFESIPG